MSQFRLKRKLSFFEWVIPLAGFTAILSVIIFLSLGAYDIGEKWQDNGADIVM